MPELVQLRTKPSKNLNSLYSTEIRDHFPFDEVREPQEMGLEAIEKAYRLKKKFVVIEGPTGSGKSGIGVAAASFAKTYFKNGFERGGYILSPQKSLTAQYMRDFECMGLLELKGQANYVCTSSEFGIESEEAFTCEDGADFDCEDRKDKTDENGDAAFCSCPYKEAKKAFVEGSLGVTNFSYFLNETKHAGQLLPRNVLVVDEAHNTENQILSMVDIVINEYHCNEVGLGLPPMIQQGQHQVAIDWLAGTFVPAADQKIWERTNIVARLKKDNKKAEAIKEGKKLNALKRYAGRIKDFLQYVLDSPNDWIIYSDDTKSSPTYGCLNIKPLTAKLFAQEILFSKADMIILMSATIGNFDFFMRNLGIDPKDAITCRIPSNFPVENRYVYIKPVASMSSTKVGCPDCSEAKDAGVEYRKGKGCSRCFKTGQVASIDLAMPKVADFLGKIMDKYSSHKGIVHTHSYKVNRYMSDNVPQQERVVTHSNVKGNRDVAIATHVGSETPTVLFSPSMTEGLDLKDDLSRFSVIVKVPFAALDPYVKARKERDQDWYNNLTALALVQATGRSNRHKEDKADHFILDKAILSFLAKNGKLFPQWWMDALKYPNA